MLRLNSDLSKVPQVGPKTKFLLNKMGLFTVGDLLYHFPFRYEDRSQIKKIADLVPGETTTIEARLSSVRNIFTKSRKKITKGYAEDETGEIALIWFNMHFIKKSLKVGELYFISGKVELFDNVKAFVVPDMELKTAKNLHSGRIVPIYPTTEGISTKWIRTRINDILSGLGAGELTSEFLPQNMLEKHNFIGREKAINEIHFPSGFELLEQAQKRMAYEEMFLELINARRVQAEWSKNKEAASLQTDPEELGKFIQTLPFTLTKDQEKVLSEITKDLSKNRPMNRLLEGDVGTGKTIVAILGALISYRNGKNVLYMAPTEILAQQHFETFQKFLGEVASNIQLVTGTTKKTIATKQIPANQSLPKTQHLVQPSITIGTHALLYANQKYINLGLVVIDEQHRFGVEQRAKLLNFTADHTVPHLLTMTATPIPRTLALTIYGDLDISILKEHPNKQRQIITKVVPKTKQDEIYRWIAQNNFSAFVVCPFIEESSAENLENVKAATAEFERLRDNFFGKENCALLHGKMSPKEKTAAVTKFRTGDIKVLISTPVIEVGIDVPDADVMVIESAERYGLASLHQLRGRVGRGAKTGYCFVFPSVFSRIAYTRLKNLENTLDGLKLAEIDMKLRGQGDIYGTLQHGFMRFKLANTNDLEFVQTVRYDVDEIAEKLDSYPNLLTFLDQRKGKATDN